MLTQTESFLICEQTLRFCRNGFEDDWESVIFGRWFEIYYVVFLVVKFKWKRLSRSSLARFLTTTPVLLLLKVLLVLRMPDSLLVSLLLLTLLTLLVFLLELVLVQTLKKTFFQLHPLTAKFWSQLLLVVYIASLHSALLWLPATDLFSPLWGQRAHSHLQEQNEWDRNNIHLPPPPPNQHALLFSKVSFHTALLPRIPSLKQPGRVQHLSLSQADMDYTTRLKADNLRVKQLHPGDFSP